MAISFVNRVSVPADVMVQEVAGESVLLNLRTEQYFGLDDVGTSVWRSLTAAPSIQAAYEQLLAEYDADADQLRSDLNDLVENLVAHGLVELAAD